MKVLPHDDLKAGLYVTVLEWKPREVPDLRGGLGFGGLGVTYRTVQDNSWVGDVLRVEAVDLPFVVARAYYPRTRTWDKAPFKLDIRRLVLRLLSPEYLEAMGVVSGEE